MVDDYRAKIIKKGDAGSNFLGDISRRTWGNSKFVSVEGHPYELAGLRFPEGKCVVVHSDVGDDSPSLVVKAESFVDNLMVQAKELGATPVGFSDIIDSRTGNDEIIHPIGNALERIANKRGLAILNGENAILGNRVVGDSNVSGTMVSIVDYSELERQGIPAFSENGGSYVSKRGTKFIIFPSDGRFLFMNSDGNGTKPEFNERDGDWVPGVDDWLAMTMDDAGKFGGRIIAASGVYETNHIGEDYTNVVKAVGPRCKSFGVLGTLQQKIGGIRSYKDGIPAFNIGGSVISVIDDKRLSNLPVPHAGDSLVVIRGKLNPRANGITDKRKSMTERFGEEWHTKDWGRIFLEYLAEPSTILYPLFKQLFDSNLATSVYHMSGGAFDGKLAKPLAQQGLYVKLFNLFEPDWRESNLAVASSKTVESAYGKCPMGNDGFIATNNPYAVIREARKRGFEAEHAGKLEKAVKGRTGVELMAFNQEQVYFSGKSK